MKLCAAACGTAALVGVLAIGSASAQPYPPYGPPYGPPAYGPYGPPPVYASPRYVPAYPPPRVLADDELPPEEIPDGPSSSVSGPYPVAPPQPSPYTGSVSTARPEYPTTYGPAPAPDAAYPPPSAAHPSGPGPASSGPPAPANSQAGAPDGTPRPPVEIDPARRQAIAALPPEDQPEAQPKELPPQLRRQLVDYVTREPAGTILIDTPSTYLYLVMGHGKAMRYGIGVGREGFTWAGVERVSKMTEWPDWYPPNEMIDRQPYLPRMMAGGPGNPLGARALYLGKSLYRIHGTNQPSTIGQFVSSGCIRLLNEDIEDLYGRVTVGTRVVVLPGHPPGPSASAQPPVPQPQGAPSVR
jgi:lipoprotein-anchoring transpeptidase ErfK/SrfK